MSLLSNFPRLKKIGDVKRHLRSLQQLLEFVRQLPSLKDITLAPNKCQDRFMESYLATKTKGEQDVLVNRLSSITKFDIRCDHGFCENTARFIADYLTGLEDFSMSSMSRNLTEQQQRAFCDNLLDIICKAKSAAHIYFNAFSLSDCPKVLPSIHDKVLTKGTLRLRIAHQYVVSSPECITLGLNANRWKKQLTLSVSKDLAFDRITSALFNGVQSPLNNISTFEFEVDYALGKYYNRQFNTNMLQEFLGKMPMLKKVILDIPQSYQSSPYCSKTFPLVEELRLLVERKVDFQALLDVFTVVFPNLKCLDLYGFKGRWNRGELHIGLAQCTLQRLTLNLSIVDSIRQGSYQQDFCVVELRLSNNHQKHLIKITVKSLSVERINESDLKGLKKYKRIIITVGDLQRFVVYFETSLNMRVLDLVTYQKDNEMNDCTDLVPHVTVFNSS